MIKYIGLLMIAAAAVFLSREYEKKEKKKAFGAVGIHTPFGARKN